MKYIPYRYLEELKMRPLGAAHNVTLETQVPPPGFEGYRRQLRRNIIVRIYDFFYFSFDHSVHLAYLGGW